MSERDVESSMHRSARRRSAVSAYRSRKFSPVEVMATVIARVEACEPHIHATYLFAPERALREARASAARWAKGEPIGPLDGVPVTIKDNIATRGEPKPVGTAASDLTPASRRRAAGGAAARSRRDRVRQDHDAGLRHAVVGPVELSSARAQSLGPRRTPAAPRRARARRGRRATGRCISAPTSAARSGCRRAGAGFSA